MGTMFLTKQNAHRVAMVRRKDDPSSAPVPFKWRGDSRIGNFNHLLGEGDAARIILPSEFELWEVVETSHPGYLEELWQAAYEAHYRICSTPEIWGEDEIAQYEKELHEDLMAMPENQREQYLNNYKDHLCGVWEMKSHISNMHVYGCSDYDYGCNERAHEAYRKRYTRFRRWRERVLKAIEKYKESQKSMKSAVYCTFTKTPDKHEK